MLEPEKISDLLLIAEKAIERMYEDGYENYFYLQSIIWDDEDSHWLVYFYCEAGSFDTVTLIIEPRGNGYICSGSASD
jgi:hypothetical protein